MLKDETTSQRDNILRVLNPLHVMYKVSQRTVQKTALAHMDPGLIDDASRIELSVIDKS